MAARKKLSGFLWTSLATVLLGVPLLVAPPVIRGLAASAWVAHYAALPSFKPPRKTFARRLVEKASIAIHNLAPLPQASTAAIRTLEIGQKVENQEKDSEAALVIYQGVRSACEAVRERPLSGAGFSVIEARAKALEDAARRASK